MLGVDVGCRVFHAATLPPALLSPSKPVSTILSSTAANPVCFHDYVDAVCVCFIVWVELAPHQRNKHKRRHRGHGRCGSCGP